MPKWREFLRRDVFVAFEAVVSIIIIASSFITIID